MIRLFFFIFSLLINFYQIESFDKEKILSFDSNITIAKDASITIEENIKVVVKGKSIKRGITRDFPTTYLDDLKNKYKVDFQILEIKKDNITEPHKVSNLSNGQRIYIGNQNYILKPGIYTYTIKYKTARQIGFFKNFDELYWNVTGNDTNFEIDKATATVNLPYEIPQSSIDFDGYTGFLDSKEKNFKAQIIENKIIFETIKPLLTHQGLTIDVIWAKGYITAPTFLTKLFYFFRDNIMQLWIIISIVITLLYYIYIYIKIRNPINEIHIPLFEPPDNLTPGQIRYIMRMKYDDKIFTAELLNMAVKGYIIIEFQNKIYTLTKKNEPEKNSFYYDLWIRLFDDSEKLILNNSNSKKIIRTIENLKSNLLFKFNKYFAPFVTYMAIGLVLSVFSAIPIIVEPPSYFFIFLTLLILINIIFSYLLKQYTKKGNKLVNEIRGFKMFLSATEKERLKFLSAPTQTPSEFEQYLPYAVALDVEQNWTNQFKTVFEKLKEQKVPYIPSWYFGQSIGYSNLSKDISKSISHFISSSQIPPGTTSGYSGGSSGRGGGGGGVGGW